MRRLSRTLMNRSVGTRDEIPTELREMSTCILAGGLGTRLRAALPDRPKVLALVGNRPFLALLLEQVSQAGIKSVILCTGHRADAIQTHFGDRFAELEIVYSREDVPLGTAGALRLALERIESDHVLVLNGDSHCAIDLSRFQRWHLESGFRASLVVTQVSESGRFGRVELDADGRITGFTEKSGSGGPGWINAGIYLMERRLLEELPHGPLSLEREVFSTWVDRGLGAYQSSGRFIDIGTPDSYASAERHFRQGL
jgi:D-glycero-alpha-D-manno-heptose 1-phosphate guanylyltransferase